VSVGCVSVHGPEIVAQVATVEPHNQQEAGEDGETQTRAPAATAGEDTINQELTITTGISNNNDVNTCTQTTLATNNYRLRVLVMMISIHVRRQP